jgi:predicted GNAT family N-acyltransferase
MTIRRSRDAAELDAALALREAVFAGEQGVPLAADRDGRDDEALHLVAVGDDGAVLATCRVLLDGGSARLGRLCVARAARRRGLASAVLAEAEREARTAGAARMVLHAQTSALVLYEQAGYLPRGERFMEEGIEHLMMVKPLTEPTHA